MPEKPHLNMVIVGHVDHGKSTCMGHILYLKGVISEREIKEYAEESQKTGAGDTFKFAWVMDRLKEERERGVTIDLYYTKFETDKYSFTIIDAPGHRDFIKNMITGASQADCALLVSSARKGEFEVGVEAGGQTREHAFLLRTLGITQLTVAVNKMDDASVNWSQTRFEECKKQLEYLLKTVGFDVSKVPIVPVSGWTGDNLDKLSDKMPWYKGPTLVETFDYFEVPPKPVDKPLRIPVQDVYTITGVGTVPVGRVETGVLKEGDTIVFMPANVKGEVRTIETHHVKIPQALPGDNIGFNVRGISKGDIRRGEVGGHPSNPPKVAKEFIGQIIVVYHPTSIAQGYTPVLHAHTAQIACKFTELIRKINPRTGETVEEKPAFLKTGDGALVRLTPVKPVALEVYSDIPQLGRFAIRDMGTTIAAGIVKEITQAG
ncbi:translation elongation factor EF-1 subunit alpha [Candidatus Hecatella orcuttiae]|jgi:elongation factor 1-alpha|uniref:translation elongation factor EF-1 subunit alpha n=1 Tax=Candidatus Hecatella orcuttiae TaxID=1935119 RepID=UPI0028682CF3|nr:translation elongation factor EF-1 subunit alpha [Candidatus Hecatella orcuttiae]